jgi:hypothetical protein
MKILFVRSNTHIKNFNFIRKCKTINFYIIESINAINNIDLNTFDAVFSPCEIIDVSKYPNTKFIFGPHCCLFPHEKNLALVKGKNSIYIQPSSWPIYFWKCCDIKTTELNLMPFAFGVDTERFVNTKDIQSRNQVFIYFKRRHPNELHYLENFLKSKNISYRIFSYVDRYVENDYLNYLQNSKYGIWLDAHESQGFALEEALSCNVPLLVWNISSMKQEYGTSYNNIPATTIPYWDETCGEFFYNGNELNNTFEIFVSKLDTYKPRDFILNNLSIDICENNLIDLVNNKFKL